MTLRDLIQCLGRHYDTGEAKAVLRLLFERAFHLSWTDVLCGAVDDMTNEQVEHLAALLQRLATGEPVQYVLGEAEFCGRWFCVSPSTLIPRPETELLVSEVISSRLPSLTPRILDIGTGSGCIAITMALAINDSHVEAWDISEDALSVATENAVRLGANVVFRKVDVLAPALSASVRGNGWDAIVSNPPYICNREREDMEANVLDFEPHTALFVPDDAPLLFYKAIARYASLSLRRGGILAFEINRSYGRDVRQMMLDMGFCNVVIVKDQFDNDRVVEGVWL